MIMTDWNKRFLDLAEHVASWSKDPSTKVGAVVAQGNQVVSIGFNGFPPGIADTDDRLEDREIKYSLVKHAEDNALFFAGPKAKGGNLYVWGMAPCIPCAASAIRAGIKDVYVKAPHNERWEVDNTKAMHYFMEAEINFYWENEHVW